MVAISFGLVGAFAFAAEASAKDYGQHGEAWGIAEPDLLLVIQNKLGAMEASGEIDRMNRSFARRATSRVEAPTPVAGLSAARSARSWLFDPSMVLDSDIRDHKGNLIAAAGTRANPLNVVSMPQPLVFLDGRRESEIEWALAQPDLADAKLVLTAGRPLDLMRRHKRRFFFDQQGKLTGKFGIRATPAVARQDGNMIAIAEEVIGGGE